MKLKILPSFLFLLFFVVTIYCSAQTSTDISSMGFNYSALVRDTAGRVTPNKLVKMRFSVLYGQTGGAPVYQETQTPTTDAYGFANVTIGLGVYVTGTVNSFAAIDFTKNAYWLMIEVYNSFTQSYDPLAKQAMQAVPYAKVAYTSIYGGTPPGSVIAFAGDTAHVPVGWELCDGRAHNVNDPKYVNLFNAIGYHWGTLNGGTQFLLPFTLGLFLRGATNGNINKDDPDASSRTPVTTGASAGDMVGSYQGDGFANHQHALPIYSDNYAIHIARAYQSPFGDFSQVFSSTADAYTGGRFNWGPSTVPVLLSSGVQFQNGETRPKNVYVNYIIKL